MPFVDFTELKARMSIVEAVELLGIDMHIRGDQLRASCPHCGGGDRTLVVTPSKGVYFCFKDGKGGDMIALAAHVREESVKDAAAFLAGTKVALTSTSKNRTSRTSSTPPEERGREETQKLQPLSYLECEHEAVVAVGFNPLVAKRLGIGYASKGIMRGLVAIPIRDEDGILQGYVGVDEARLPKDFQMPENVIPMRKQSA
jgi:DNA primase